MCWDCHTNVDINVVTHLQITTIYQISKQRKLSSFIYHLSVISTVGTIFDSLALEEPCARGQGHRTMGQMALFLVPKACQPNVSIHINIKGVKCWSN